MATKNLFKGFLFDLDGTLLDTAPDLLAALNHLLRQNRKPELNQQDIRATISSGSEGLIKLGLGIDKNAPEFNLLKSEFLDYYQTNLYEKTVVFSGIQEVLNKIDESKRPWGIVTNKPSCFTIPLVNHFGWNLRAKCLICGDSLEHSKPHPQPLLEAAKCLGLNPKDCVYVGDAVTDIQASKAAGMRVITAGYGYLPDQNAAKKWNADGYLRTPSELDVWLQ